MTINQYIKSLEKAIAHEKTPKINHEWEKERLSVMNDAIETLGKKEVRELSKHVMSGEIDRVSIDFFALCYGYARACQQAYRAWYDDGMNAQAIKIYEAWRKHHA